MKRFIKKHKDVFTVLLLLFVWRIYLIIVQMNTSVARERHGYLGEIRIDNFDGYYYLRLATSAYHGLDQAFFPLFPIAINVFYRLGFDPISAAVIVVTTSLFGFLYFFLKLIKIDYNNFSYVWMLLFYLAFPTSFFLGSVYTESFFLFLTILSFYFGRQRNTLFAGFFGGLASATRVVGIFLFPSLLLEEYENQKHLKKKDYKRYIPLLLVPIGLISYMVYLGYMYHDPLLFVHQQPQFGAGRSGGGIVLLPQVLFRYMKIFLTVSKTDLVFWISVTEILTLLAGFALLVLGYKKGIRRSYILFSFCALFFPTLSGTLSSLPRYILVSFAIFMYLGLIKNIYVKLALLLIGLFIEGLFAILFLQGYFVS